MWGNTNDQGELVISTDLYAGQGFAKISKSYSYTSTGGGAADNFDVQVVGADVNPETNGHRLYKVYIKVDPAGGAAFAADKLDIKIVDKEGIISPEGTVLSNPVDNRYLWAGLEHQYIADPQEFIPHGMYYRARYVSDAASPAVKFTVELVRRVV